MYVDNPFYLPYSIKLIPFLLFYCRYKTKYYYSFGCYSYLHSFAKLAELDLGIIDVYTFVRIRLFVQTASKQVSK